MSGKVIAIIPARAGSKRIPNKNIIPFRGKPMIAWTIEAALASNICDDVIVSTDSMKIAEISRSFGATVPFLREINHDDRTPVSKATITALQQSESYFDCHFDVIIQLMPNCPLRSSSDIVQAYKNFQQQGAAFQISCFQFMLSNPWWAVKLSDNGEPDSLFPQEMTSRSQDLPDLYCPTGAIWIANRDALIDSKTFYGKNHRFFPLNWQSAIDIDTKDDLQLAYAVALLQSNIECRNEVGYENAS